MVEDDIWNAVWFGSGHTIAVAVWADWPLPVALGLGLAVAGGAILISVVLRPHGRGCNCSTPGPVIPIGDDGLCTLPDCPGCHPEAGDA